MYKVYSVNEVEKAIKMLKRLDNYKGLSENDPFVLDDNEIMELQESITGMLEDYSVKVSTGPAQGKEGTKTKPCQTRDFSGHKQYLVAS